MTAVKMTLRALSIPLDEGRMLVSTKRPFENEVRRVIKERGLNVKIQYNRDDLMILPAGIDKAVGVKEALARLGLKEAELICIGDAENDLPLFEIADLRVATENAIPEVKNKADVVCIGMGGVGVTRFLSDILARMSRSAFS